MPTRIPPRTIALVDMRTAPAQPLSTGAFTDVEKVSDTRSRPLRDLRISVTDRCNFRCNYCMPKDVFTKDYPYLPHASLLSFEEITRLAQQFIRLGVQKIRLTGGEPLLRKNIEYLIAQLAALRTRDGLPLDLTLTTNGSLLARMASSLRSAGLQRITVSLDGLDDAVFRRMNDVDFPVARVLEGIEAAKSAGLGPVKVNMVVKRGCNEQEILPMVRHFKGTGVTLRCIEYMVVGTSNGWSMADVLPSADVVALIQKEIPLIALEPTVAGETAQRWGFADANGKHNPQEGEIGVISSVTQAFCHDCNRARLSTEGALYLCLFAQRGHDLRTLLRGNASDDTIAATIAQIWAQRTDHYSELRAHAASSNDAPRPRIEMSYIGG